MTLFEAVAKFTVDTSEFIKGLKNVKDSMNDSKKSLADYRKDVAKLASEYKKSGMSSSEAWKKAYSEIDKSLYNLGKDATDSSAKINSFGNVFGNLKEKVTSAFSGVKSAAELAGNGISVFGDVLKANILSDAITKGFETIVNGFKSVGNAADNFVKSSVSVGMSFDSAMSQVYATMGDKAETEIEYNGKLMKSSEALRQFAKEMGATTKYSATESAEALNYMALAGYEAELSMEMLPNVMNLASAGAFDLARASDMITDTQTAMGLSVERTTQLVDEMAKAASTGNTSVEQLGDAFLTVGGLAKELNGGFVTLANGTKKPVDGVQELEIALTAMANAGIKGSAAGTHMRNLLLKLASPTEDATKLFEELGISVFDDAGNMNSLKDIFDDMQAAFADMNNQQKKLQAISEIFNARDTSTAEALLAAVEEGWDSIGESILQAKGAASKMSATQMDNLQGWKTIFNSAKEGLQISISEALEPTLRQIVKFGGESLQALTDTIQKDGIKNLGKAISSIMGKSGTLLMNNLPNFSRNVLKVLTAIKNGIADGIPVFLSYARAAIVRTLVLVQKELPEFLKAGKRITTELGKGLAREFPYILRQVTSLANKIKGKIAENIPVILPAVTSGILTIITELTKPEYISGFIDSGMQIITAIANGIGGSVSAVAEKAPEIINNLKQGFEDNKETLKNAGDTILSAIADGLGLSGKWEDVKSKLTEGFQNIDFANITSRLSDLIIGVTDSAGNFIDGIDWSVIGEAIAEALNGIKWREILQSIFDTIETAIKNAPELLKGIANALDSGTAVQIATLGINLLVGKQFVGALATYLLSESALTTLAPAMGTLFSKCAPVIGAAIVGWDIGTLIYNANKDSIDEGMAKIIDDIKNNLYTVKALWDWTFNNKEGLSVKQLYKNIALEETANGTGFQSDKYRQMVLDWGQEDIYESFGSGNGMNFFDFENSVKENLDTIKWLMNDTANSEEIQNAGKDLADNFGSGIAESVKSGESMADIIRSVKKAAGIDTETEMKNSGKNVSKMFADGISENSYKVHDSIDGITQEISDNLEHHSPAKKGRLSDDDTWMPNMIQMFADGIRDNTYLVVEKITNLGESVKSEIFMTIDGAVSWGSDMIDNFISGIHQKWNDAVNTVSGFAGMIASYIGFSEPEKGALSKFHTFAPDMLKLFSNGIKENAYLAENEIKALSDNIADSFQNPVTLDVETEMQSPEMPEISDMQSKIQFFTEDFNLPEIPDMIAKIKFIMDEIKLPDIQDIVSKIDFIIGNIPKVPEIPDKETNIHISADNLPEFSVPDMVSKISFLADKEPDFQNQDVEIRFLDNLDSIIEKIKNLTDKRFFIYSETDFRKQNFINPEYELPELSLKADFNVLDKVKELFENPLEITAKLSDFTWDLQNTPEIQKINPIDTDYIKQIDDIKNSYSTTNYYNNIENNSYSPSRNYTNESNGNSITVQNLTINVPGFNIESPSDMNRLGNALKDTIIEILDVQAVRDNRDLGGVGWTL